MNNKKILQTLDIQDNCKGVFLTDLNRFELEDYEKVLKNYSIAWKHSPILNDEENRYLFLSARTDDLSQFCADPEVFSEYKRKLEAHQRAASTAKVSLDQECFFNLLPEHQLLKWFQIKGAALSTILDSLDKEPDYDILHKAHVLTANIARQKINFDNKQGRVIYNIFGSATGRLTTKRGSVPVLTLKKQQRDLLKPQNDAFVEFDLNAAEIRMLMALMGQEQPRMDIHDWISENVFHGDLERQDVKVKVFSWLYNFSAPKSRLDEIFSRQIFRDFYFSEKQLLTTPFGRKLVVEERKAQNYLLQSTTSDQVIENAYKIQKMLCGKKSKISFTLHDSIVLDISSEDVKMLKDIKEQFETTRWGKFVSTCKVGKTFGNLKELKI